MANTSEKLDGGGEEVEEGDTETLNLELRNPDKRKSSFRRRNERPLLNRLGSKL